MFDFVFFSAFSLVKTLKMTSGMLESCLYHLIHNEIRVHFEEDIKIKAVPVA